MKLSRGTIKFLAPILVAFISILLIELHLLAEPALMFAQLILFISIILVIWESSELLVESSQEIAQHFKVSPFLIGLTVVAFGTSFPELGTSLVAGFGGRGDIAIANIAGSNILNISVILGGLALLTKGGLAINRQTIKLDAPLLIVGTLLILLFIGTLPVEASFADGLTKYGLLDLKLGVIEASVLFGLFLFYIFYIIKKREKSQVDSVDSEKSNKLESSKLTMKILRMLAGLTFVMLGCHVLVGEVELVDGVMRGYGAVWFASVLGIPDYLIGLSIVALGTSAPEIVVSLSAIRSNALDIGIGNLLGSAIFNIFAVLGIAGLMVQPPIADAISIHTEAIQSLVAMGFLFILLLIFLTTSQRLSRKEGLVLFSTGLAYMIYEVVAYMPSNNL